MPEYIEKFNIVVASTTEYNASQEVIGYSYKETTYPFVGLAYLVVIFSFLIVVAKILKR